MEKIISIRLFLNGLVAVLVLVLFSANASAQMMRLTPEERANRLKDSLKLSAGQTEKVKAIFEENQKEMQSTFQSSSGDRESMRTAMQEQMKKTDAKIEALLTPKQKIKYEEMKKNRPQFGKGRSTQ